MSRLPVHLILTASVCVLEQAALALETRTDVATLASWPHAQLERPLSCTNEPHPSTVTTLSRFAFASKEELSKLADLVDEGFTPANTARQNHSLARH